jgi:predicted dehydrogenase
MRFALLGNHPDGVALASALAASGRHQLLAWAGPDKGGAARWEGTRRAGDLEEALADPAVEAVIVAGAAAVRPAQLRRALQSERHVLCVHPPGPSPEVAYEAALLQKDTGYVLFPVLPEALHPALRRLADFVERPGPGQPGRSPVGAFRLLEVERASAGEVLDNLDAEGHKPALPGWDVLRLLGGEVIEVSALAEGEALEAGAPVLLAGRFERGGLFQVTLLPHRPGPHWRLAVVGSAARAEVVFPQGWQGPAFLEWRDEAGETREEYWEPWAPWPALVEAFEAALKAKGAAPLSWEDAVRALELDDAARRSVERRRTNLLEHLEASEEVGFKGTMTLVGCGLFWVVLLLLIASRWVPQLGWAILPLLLLFVGLQLLRYLIPREPPEARPRP